MTLSQQSFSSQSLLGFFLIATPFPALSILTILLDKHQVKSFENINILIKVQLFVGKSFFFSKKDFIWKKTVIWKKEIIFLEKNFFEKKLFFYLWRLKVSSPKS